MQIGDILSVLWRRRWIILIVLVVCVGVSALLTVLTPATYLTVATMRVLTPGTSLNDSGTWINTQYSDRLNATYLEVLVSEPVLMQLAERLGTTYEALPDITVNAVSGTELMQIQVYDRDPNIANTFAQMVLENPYWLFGDRRSAIEAIRQKLFNSDAILTDLRQQYEDIFESANPNRNTVDALRSQIALEEQTYRDLSTQYQNASLLQEVQNSSISLVSGAEPPKDPFRPSRTLNLAIGTFVGLLGGLALALVIENFDTALYTTKQIEKVVGSSIIGLIPKGKRSRTPILRTQESPILEAFRWMRANIVAQADELQTLLVTSAADEEGKTTVASNLAVAIAQTNRRVLLIDAELHNPELHTVFGLGNDVGLSEVLLGTAELQNALQQPLPTELYVLTSGAARSQALDLLSSDSVRMLLQSARGQFDIIIVDTPAVALHSEAIAMTPMVDGVVVVMERGRTSEEELRNLLASISFVDGRVAGVVVNRVDRGARSLVTAARKSQLVPAREPLSAGQLQAQPRLTDEGSAA